MLLTRRTVVTTALCSLPLVAQNAAPPVTPLARLQANIDRITRSVNAQWGIYMKCLETGEEINMGADATMDTMSVIKLPLMYEVFRQIEAGKFALTDKVTLAEKDKRPGTGILRSLDNGDGLTIKDMITLMIIVSDNTATDFLFDKVGGVDAVNQTMAKIGLATVNAPYPCAHWFAALRAAPSADQFHREAKTPYGLASPHDIGRLLEMMSLGKAVSKSASDQMLAIMRGQVYSSRLPKYVTGFRLPHKTGDFLPYIGNDVGILERDDRHIVLCVFTAKHYGQGPALEDAIGRVAQQVADYYQYRA